MEKSDRESEEVTYLWIPIQCLDQTLKAILKCLGLFHQDSPTKTASSPGTSNQPEEEEEEDVTVKEEVVVTSRGIKHGRTKKRGKENISTGRPGQNN